MSHNRLFRPLFANMSRAAREESYFTPRESEEICRYDYKYRDYVTPPTHKVLNTRDIIHTCSEAKCSHVRTIIP